MPESSDITSPIDNEGSFSHSSHDVDLQRLDINLPYPGTASGKLKYAIDNFAGTESEWDKTLAVYVPKGVPIQHVDHAAFARDPHGEARRLGFRIAGHHENSQVITGSGEPRLSSKVVFTDPEADQFAREGALSPSTGLDAMILQQENAISGKIRPNHVLYFHRNEKTAFGTPATPNDLGARVNNLSEETMADDETKGTLSKILEHVTPKENPLQKTVDNLNAEVAKRDAQIKTLTDENAALKADKTALDNLRAEQENKAKETRWQEVRNLHQPGLFHKEKEAVERAAYEQDPAGWLMAHVGNLQTVKAKPAQGAAAVGNLEDDETKPFDTGAARGKLNPATGRFE